MFGERLESLLTGSQIDEVMVMDGGNKGLDVLSVVSDEAGMNHPSGAATHDAAQYRRSPPPSLRPSVPLPSHHYGISARTEQSVNIQQQSVSVSVCVRAYFEGGNKAWLVISKHGVPAVQRVACVSLISPPTRIHRSHLLSDCDAREAEIQSTSSASPREWGHLNKKGI